ncbi:MAG: aminoacyl-tRNA hydrolase [Phycisphaeraceae bacterium]|nr:MAG: aminoacyl-tRNA hydrolase [Phycisphaeraceae bacterium]
MNDASDPQPAPEPIDDGAAQGGAAGAIDLAAGLTVPRAALRMTATRSSGPGGQNVNKRSTRVELRVFLRELPIDAGVRRRLTRLAGPGALIGEGPEERELRIVSDEHRSQRRNREECIERLRELVRRALVPPKPRKKTRPTKGSVERRLEEKRQRSQIKQRRRGPDE